MPTPGHDYGIDTDRQLKNLNWADIRQQRNANPTFAGRYFNPHVGVTWVDGETTDVKHDVTPADPNHNPALAYVYPMQNPGRTKQTNRVQGLHHIIVEIDAPAKRARAGAVSVSSGGAITGIAVYDGGMGYTAPPAVHIVSSAAGAGAGAAANAIINAQGVVTNINVTAGGAGYRADVRIVVSIDAPPAGRTASAGAINLSPTGAITGIAVADGGSRYRQAPKVVIRGGGSNAKASAAIDVHGAVTAINVTDGGSGYSEDGGIIVKVKAPPPAVTAKAGAVTVSATGAITKIAVKKGGCRYATAPGVHISSNAGSGAKATTTINAQGVVTKIDVTDGGSQYRADTAVLVTIDDPPPAVAARAGAVTLSPTGAITNIAVANGGAGYKLAPAVRIISGVGAGATATARIDAQGVVTRIDVTAAGAGYRLPNPDPDFVRNWGEIDANATCSRIWDVVKGGELAFPDSKSVIVYLDIEAGVSLSPDYWYGWASKVYWFCTGFFQWPFYPGVYCVTQHDPLDSGTNELSRIPSDDVQDGLTLQPNSCSSRCCGIFATNPQVDHRFDLNFQPDWENRFHDWTQTVHVIFGLIPWDFSVKVLLWQYGMQSLPAPGNPNPSPATFNALNIDLDETSPSGEATRRMLKVP